MLNNTEATSVEQVARWATGLVDVDPRVGTEQARTALAYLVARAHDRLGAGLRPGDVHAAWPQDGHPTWLENLKKTATALHSSPGGADRTRQLLHEVLAVAIDIDTDPIVPGLPRLPDGVDPITYAAEAADARAWLTDRSASGKATWFDVLATAVNDVGAASGDRALRRQLILLAAIAVMWAHVIEDRTAEPPATTPGRPADADATAGSGR